jgi:hypothetical protein
VQHIKGLAQLDRQFARFPWAVRNYEVEQTALFPRALPIEQVVKKVDAFDGMVVTHAGGASIGCTIAGLNKPKLKGTQ